MTLKAFKLCFNKHLTFVLLSRMLNKVNAILPPPPPPLPDCLACACVPVDLLMTYHVPIHSNNLDCSLRLNTRLLVNVDDVLDPFALPSSQHRLTSFNKIGRILKQMLKPFARDPNENRQSKGFVLFQSTLPW